jgi:lysozyme family protein
MIAFDAFAAGYITRWEGGLSLDANDAGNWSTGQKGKGQLLGSKYGVTGRALAAYRGKAVTKADIANLTLAEACAVARKLFYADPGLANLPWNRVTASIVDFGWGAGPVAAKKLVQDMVDVAQDGVIGVNGLTARTYGAWVDVHGEATAAGAWWALREKFYEDLVARRPSDGIYLRGWDNRSRWFLPGQVEKWWEKAA